MVSQDLALLWFRCRWQRLIKRWRDNLRPTNRQKESPRSRKAQASVYTPNLPHFSSGSGVVQFRNHSAAIGHHANHRDDQEPKQYQHADGWGRRPCSPAGRPTGQTFRRYPAEPARVCDCASSANNAQISAMVAQNQSNSFFFNMVTPPSDQKKQDGEQAKDDCQRSADFGDKKICEQHIHSLLVCPQKGGRAICDTVTHANQRMYALAVRPASVLLSVADPVQPSVSLSVWRRP